MVLRRWLKCHILNANTLCVNIYVQESRMYARMYTCAKISFNFLFVMSNLHYDETRPKILFLFSELFSSATGHAYPSRYPRCIWRPGGGHVGRTD